MKSRIALILLFGLLPFLFAGCIEEQYIFADYAFRLSEVKTSRAIKERYSKGEITDIEKSKHVYEDELIQIVFRPTCRAINFSIKNKVDSSLKIIWNEAAYLDENNSSHRVLHYGVKYIDRDRPQAPSVIMSGGTLEDIFYPTDYVKWYASKWKRNPILPEKPQGRWGERYEEFKQEVISLKGRTISILLPIEVEGFVGEYTFTFLIENVYIYEGKERLI